MMEDIQNLIQHVRNMEMMPHYHFLNGIKARGFNGYVGMLALISIACVGATAITVRLIRRPVLRTVSLFDQTAHIGYLMVIYHLGYGGLLNPYAHFMFEPPVFSSAYMGFAEVHVLMDLAFSTLYVVVLTAVVHLIAKLPLRVSILGVLSVVVSLISLLLIAGTMLLVFTKRV